VTEDRDPPTSASSAPSSRVRWDPDQYRRYADERSRPFFDLVARVDASSPRLVVDLGCGPGELTAALAERWPGARVVGVDSSPEMIERAGAHVRPNLSFELGDLREHPVAGPIDVIVSNATLQWVPGHEAEIVRLAGLVAPGGWLAFQVPGNFRSPSHARLAALRLSPRWRDRVGKGAERHLAVRDPAEYAELLTGLGLDVDVWETTYLHRLHGPDPVLEWVRGTGLRPVLSVLEGAERDAFTAEYAAALVEAYPPGPDGVTNFPFRRIFAVAHRGA